MSKEIWLSVDEVSHLSEETKETVRRKCKHGEYVAVFEKQGKYYLCSLSVKFKQFGKDALLSKKGLKDKEYRIKPEYYEISDYLIKTF